RRWTMSRARRSTAVLALGVSLALATTGCEWTGLNSLPMPGAEGKGEGAYEVHIQMPNVTTLTQNSPVRIDDVDVGSVTDIVVQDWHALVTVSLNPDVRLPANAIARIGQTSLLGSNHVELAPPEDVAPQGQLAPGDVIPLDRAGAYPTTEEVLSSLSVVLNGGGIAQLETITSELNAALSGREDVIRDLLPQLDELTTNLEQQTGDIISAMEGLDRLGGPLADPRATLEHALDEIHPALTFLADQRATRERGLDEIHPALTVLADRRENITRAITALGELSDVTQRVIDTSGENLKANLNALWPTLQRLADTGGNLAESLKILLS